jgi:hypothetical protein
MWPTHKRHCRSARESASHPSVARSMMAAARGVVPPPRAAAWEHAASARRLPRGPHVRLRMASAGCHRRRRSAPTAPLSPGARPERACDSAGGRLTHMRYPAPGSRDRLPGRRMTVIRCRLSKSFRPSRLAPPAGPAARLGVAPAQPPVNGPFRPSAGQAVLGGAGNQLRSWQPGAQRLGH